MARDVTEQATLEEELRRAKLAAERRDSLRHVLSGAQHLLALINEVLDIAAVEEPQLTRPGSSPGGPG